MSMLSLSEKRLKICFLTDSTLALRKGAATAERREHRRRQRRNPHFKINTAGNFLFGSRFGFVAFKGA
ncbi:hypothetical protein VNO80_08607 [Phaseolus coccineus]|uniref:Uncharacterized protein n=1 Tax=Phaseolus coccineus TaxID=3886 RepID=A0AAN9N575_PHACN